MSSNRNCNASSGTRPATRSVLARPPAAPSHFPIPGLPLKEFTYQQPQCGARNDAGRTLCCHDDPMCCHDDTSWPNNMSERLESALPASIESTIEIAFAPDADGDTHLHLAIMYDLTEVAEALIDLAPDSSYLNIANNLKQTPLHIATLIGRASLVRHLLLAGADCTGHDCHGNTALHYACAQADRASVQALTEPISVGELVEAMGRLADHTRISALNSQLTAGVDQWNYQGLSCLHLATLAGDVDIVAHLICFGASVEATEGCGGRSALHLSLESRDLTMSRFLLLHCGARATSCNYAGTSCLQLAAAAAAATGVDSCCCRQLLQLMLTQQQQQQQLVNEATTTAAGGSTEQISVQVGRLLDNWWSDYDDDYDSDDDDSDDVDTDSSCVMAETGSDSDNYDNAVTNCGANNGDVIGCQLTHMVNKLY